MLPELQKKLMEKQGYKIVGTHSAVKTCSWTRKMLNNEGECYKYRFYGIKSHQCMQMTTSLSCANRCEFCWRDYKAPVSKTWDWKVDDAIEVVEGSLEAQKSLLTGFGGSEKVNKELLKEAETVKHVALSLTGEPIIYPKLNESIEEFHRRGITTFMVTNGQYPEEMKKMLKVTQLYMSVDAPNKELLKDIDKPLFADYWERFNDCLDCLKERREKLNERTVIRLTLVKGKNMCDARGYAKLIKKGNPEFIEVKGFMAIGAAEERLGKDYMPTHEEVKKFSEELLKYLPEYEYSDEQEASFVVCLAKKTFKKKTWIDFDTFFTDWFKDKKEGIKLSLI